MENERPVIRESHHDILGVEPDASRGDIKARFQELALKHHPDHGGNPNEFRKLVEAKNRCLAECV
jgi:curved DNA-binding protein CbpA